MKYYNYVNLTENDFHKLKQKYFTEKIFLQ